MRILSIGQFSADGISNTCLHRNWALKKCGDVREVDSTLVRNRLLYRIINRLFVRYHLPIHFPTNKLNKAILKELMLGKYDVMWIDKGVFVSEKTLKKAKESQPNLVIVGYSPDNMAERHNQSQHFLESLKYYDHFVTTKSYTVDALKNLGVKDVIFVNNAYEPTFHHPYSLTSEETKRLGGSIGFIGSWEKERFLSMKYLAENGLQVHVWGGGKWKEYKGKIENLKVEGDALFSEDYNKAISAFDISLCFLRKMNADLQTTRTMEIPACGSMLMAERTIEHEQLFEDGTEAVFFSDNDELLEKCRYYLLHPDKRKEVADNGKRRCETSGYSNEKTIKSVFRKIGLLA